MRRVIWLVVLAAVIWSGWWALATMGAVRAVEHWLATRQAEGWQAETSGIAFEGYPLDMRITLKDMALADPQTGIALQASALSFHAPVWDPGNITLVLPDDPILLANPDSKNELLTQDAQVRLEVQKNAALDLETMQASADAWLLDAPAGDVLAGGASRTAFIKDPDSTATYHFTLDVDALRPGTVPRTALRIPQDWPVAFERFSLQATLRFDRPWDITALEVSRPQPSHITIDHADILWGALQLRIAAALDIDPAGAASGTLSLQARNWREMLSLAERGGVLPAGLRAQVEQVLSTFAGLAGNTETLDLTLSLRDGVASLGFLPLGQVPRLRLR